MIRCFGTHEKRQLAPKTDHGASYPDGDVRKAVLHAWLAWQQEPGLPYGTAIRARYFMHDSPVAARFVAWFRRLFAWREQHERLHK